MLTLWDDDKKIAPSVAGFIFLVVQNEGNRLLVSDLNEGHRGWASPLDMVPLNQAEVYFRVRSRPTPTTRLVT